MTPESWVVQSLYVLYLSVIPPTDNVVTKIKVENEEGDSAYES